MRWSGRVTKATRIVIRLAAEDRDWIRSEAERIGVDSATLVRMLIRQARNAPGGLPVHYGDEVSEDQVRSIDAAVGDEFETGDWETVEQEQSLDSLMEAGPSLLDEAAAEPEPAPLPERAPAMIPFTFAAESRYRFQRTPQRTTAPQRPAPQRAGYAARQVNAPPGAFRAGSMTRAVGVGDGTRGNVTGDGIGNVIRDNYAHFGFVGTRSR